MAGKGQNGLDRKIEKIMPEDNEAVIVEVGLVIG
jgi:hypothetical protein